MAGYRGASMVELLVAVVLLELTMAAVVAASLAAERQSRASTLAAATDARRWQAWHAAERSPSCVSSPLRSATILSLPAAPGRPALQVVIRCGR